MHKMQKISIGHLKAIFTGLHLHIINNCIENMESFYLPVCSNDEYHRKFVFCLFFVLYLLHSLNRISFTEIRAGKAAKQVCVGSETKGRDENRFLPPKDILKSNARSKYVDILFGTTGKPGQRALIPHSSWSLYP